MKNTLAIAALLSLYLVAATQIREQAYTTHRNKLESCKVTWAASLGQVISQTIVLGFFKPKKQDVTFFPVLTAWKSNYHELEDQAKANKIFFDAQGAVQGNIQPFLSGKIFVLVHGHMDSYNSSHRIFGVGM